MQTELRIEGGWRRLLPVALSFGALIAQGLFLTGVELSSLPIFSRDGTILAATFLMLAGLPSAVGFLVLAGLAERLLRTRHIPGLTAATAGILVIFLLDALIARLISGPAGVTQALRQHLAPAGFLLWAAFGVRGRRSVPAVHSLIAGILALVASCVLSASGGALRFSFPEEVTAHRTEAPHKGRILLIGLDGLGWETMQRWRNSSDSEAGRWIFDHAYAAPLRTFTPTMSPLIWSTIATGLTPENHGVLDYVTADFKWLARSRVSFHPNPTLLAWRKVLQRFGVLSVEPVSSLDLHAHPFWEIITDSRRRADVVGWWATWPPQPFQGRLVSQRFHFNREEPMFKGAGDQSSYLTFPPQLEAQLAKYRRLPESVTATEVLRFADVPAAEASQVGAQPWRRREALSELVQAIAMDSTALDIARAFLRSSPANGIAAFYFRGVDIVSHSALRYSTLDPETEMESSDRQRYGELVSRYYDYTFQYVKELVELAGPDAIVMIVSDHGFRPHRNGSFEHTDAPDGILLAFGAGASPTSEPRPASVYDVTPSLLWLTGYPLADDMPGNPWREVFPNIRDAATTPARIPTYGYRWIREPVRMHGDDKTDEEILEMLRSLGYIQ